MLTRAKRAVNVRNASPRRRSDRVKSVGECQRAFERPDTSVRLPASTNECRTSGTRWRTEIRRRIGLPSPQAPRCVPPARLVNTTVVFRVCAPHETQKELLDDRWMRIPSDYRPQGRTLKKTTIRSCRRYAQRGRTVPAAVRGSIEGTICTRGADWKVARATRSRLGVVVLARTAPLVVAAATGRGHKTRWVARISGPDSIDASPRRLTSAA